MIASVEFRKGVRDIFREGESIDLKPLTVIVGDNGTGKSTFIGSVTGCLQSDRGDGKVVLRKSGRPLERWVVCDFEKDNVRTMCDSDRIDGFCLFSRMSMSHGETVMRQIEGDFSGIKDYLVLFDEPDQCLSPRSAYRMYEVLRRMVDDNGCQVIITCHSVPLMEMAGEVYSMEHRRWMRYEEFLKSQKEEKRNLRWTDECDEYCDPYVVAVMDDGRSMYWCGEDAFSGQFQDGIREAVPFNTRRDAEKFSRKIVGKKFPHHAFGSKIDLKVVSAGVRMISRVW